MKAYKNIDTYIRAQPKEVQAALKTLRTTIKKVAPGVIETISYGIPTFKLNGTLVHFGAFKSHIGFFPGPTAIAAYKKKLAIYKTSKGTIQFPLSKPIPSSLVEQIVKYRVKENRVKGASKSSSSSYVHYHKDGSVWAKGKIVNGKMEGYWEWFRKDGSKMRSGHFIREKQVGQWITYDKAGKVVKVTNFDKKNNAA
jgi:uncharacterized protein YdhG (YjbR/CyaY superfamily)